jgi:regulatory protein
MVITALKQQIKNPERVSVFVDGKYVFSLTLNQVVAEKIKVGLELTEESITEFKKKSTNEKLRLKTMNWVLMRPRSERELRDYLRRQLYQHKPTSPGVSRVVVDKEDSLVAHDAIASEFTTRGWVDDEVFARWWIERSSRSKRSNSYLKSELMQKGVDREIIADLLGDRADDDLLAELVQKLRQKSKYQDNQRLMRYLVTKGFSYSSVADALRLAADDSPA